MLSVFFSSLAMAIANTMLLQLSETDRQKLQALLAEFDSNWHKDVLPDFVQKLPRAGSPFRMPALNELVKIDLKRQWKLGRRLMVEDYLRFYPELGTPDTVAPELVETEFRARRQSGASVDLADFVGRFPRQAKAISQLLRNALTQSASEPIQQSRETPLPSSTPSFSGPVAGPAKLPEGFGRYHIVKRLGQGGMGSVYLAHDEQLDRSVALKIPHFRPEDGPKVLERFYREARAAATLEHPNICPVHDVGEVGGIPYLTMAYVEGKPLSDFVRRDKPLSQAQAAAVVRKLALALQEAHSQGVIHRDLKPANIMINTRREPVIMDFGLARRARKGEARLTQNGLVLGTPSYMPPEQVSGDVDAMGPTCDIYSLGIILYELLTGRVPFAGDVMAVLVQIVTDEPRPPRFYRPELDPALEAICLRAIAKKPENRYSSMAEMAKELAEYLRNASRTSAASLPAPVLEGAAKPESANPNISLSSASEFISHFLRRNWIAATAGIILFAGIVIIVATKQGTVRLEVEDPNARIDIRSDNGTNQVLNSIGMKLVSIPSGKFLMGPADRRAQPSEWPRHWVEITRAFQMSAFEVTQEQYEIVVGKNPSWFCPTAEGKDQVAGQDTRQFPVEMVSWEDAASFCRKLSERPEERQARRAYRLPTEAEWEYACRAGTDTIFHFGNSLSSNLANIDGRFPFGGADRGIFLDRTTRIGSYRANGWGLCDMHGNVWEWCADYFSPTYYGASPPSDPQGASNGETRVVRGGGWFDVHPHLRRDDWRCANRGQYPPGARLNHVGFRVVSVLAPNDPLPEAVNVAAQQEQLDPILTSPAEKPVNLLELIDLQKTFVQGEWTFRQGALVSPRTAPSLLQIPYEPPEEYRVVVVAERAWKREALLLGLVVGDSRVTVLLDGYGGTKSGLQLIDGKRADQNETTRPGPTLKDSKPSTIICAVRKKNITVHVDGHEMVNFNTDSERLSVQPIEHTPSKRVLFLTTYSSYYIYKLELIPMSGQGRPIEPSVGELRRFASGGTVHAVALSPDGSRLMAGTTQPFLRLWDVRTGRHVQQFEGHRAAIDHGLVFTRDGRRVVSGSYDSTIRLWDLETGQDLYHFTGHTGSVTSLALSPEGRRLLSGGTDGTVRLWDMPAVDGENADGHGLKADIFDGPDLKNKVFERIDNQIDRDYFQSSPDPTRIGPNMYSIRWTGWLKAPAKGHYRFIVPSDDGVRVWIDDKKIIDGWNSLIATYRGEIDLGEVPHSLKIEYYQQKGRAGLSFRWAQVGGFLEQAVPRAALFHDLKTAQKAVVELSGGSQRFLGHKGTVWGVAFSPKTQRAVSVGEDGTMRLWDVVNGKELRRFEGHRGPIWCVTFSPDGSQILSGGSDHSVRLWDASRATELRRFMGHRAGVRSVAFAPDPRRAISGSFDHTVRLWDLEAKEENQKQIFVFRGHRGEVHSVGFFEDGRRIFSGGADSTLRIWTVPEIPPKFKGRSAAQAIPGNPVDLLGLIDLQNRFRTGNWSLERNGLVSPDRNVALQIPYKPPEEYDVEIEAEKIGNGSGLFLGLVSGASQFQVIVDGWNGLISGLDMLDNLPANLNEATAKGAVLKEKRPYTLRCAVRRYGIMLACDGRKIIDWKGDLRRLAMAPGVEIPNSEALFLHVLASFRFKRVTLIPIGGERQQAEDLPREIRRFPYGATSVAFSPDCHRLFYGSDRFIRLCDLDTASETLHFEGHHSRVSDVAILPDSRHILSASMDGSIRLWDASNREDLYHFASHPRSWVRALAVAPDGSQCASAGEDGTVRLWNIPVGINDDKHLLKDHGLKAEYFQGTKLKDKFGERVERQQDWLFEFVAPFPLLRKEHYSIRWSGWLKAPRPGRYTITTISDDGIRLWLDDKLLIDEWHNAVRTAYHCQVDLTELPHKLKIEYFQGTWMARMTFLWSQAGGFTDRPVPAEALFHNKITATTTLVKLPEETRRLEGHKGGVFCVAFSPDGRRILSGGLDGTIRLWEAATGKEISRFEAHQGCVRAAIFVENGRSAVTGGQDHSVRVWNLATGKEMARYMGHKGPVTSVRLAPDGRRLLSGSDDHTLRLWDLADGTTLGRFIGHTGDVVSVAISSDGHRAASASHDGYARVWQLPK